MRPTTASRRRGPRVTHDVEDAMKRSTRGILAVTLRRAGCVASSPPAAPAGSDPASPLGSPFAEHGTVGMPLLLDRTDLRIGTTVEFSRMPTTAELYDLNQLPGLAHVVI